MITVKSGLADKSRIALFEIHPDHPGGEVVVKGEGEFQVAGTRAALNAIAEGRLIEVARIVAKAAPVVEAVETEEAETETPTRSSRASSRHAGGRRG